MFLPQHIFLVDIAVCGILFIMDVSDRTWRIKPTGGKKEGPLTEEEFQNKLRAGDVPLTSMVKSNKMKKWKPLIEVITCDETFLRPSSMPPPPPSEENS